MLENILNFKNILNIVVIVMILQMIPIAFAESSTEQKMTLSQGQTIPIGGEYFLTIKQIDVDSNQIWIKLNYGVNEIKDDICTEGDMFEYKDQNGNLIIAAYMEQTFRGIHENLVVLNTMLYYGTPPELYPQIYATADGSDVSMLGLSQLSKGELKEFNFKITNIGRHTSGIESYFSISVSPGLKIKSYSSSSEDMNFKLNPVGNDIYNINNKQIESRYELLDVWKAYEPMESQTISIVVEAISSGEQFIKYRTAFDTVEEGYSFIRNPESSTVIDQQGFYSYNIPISVNNDEDSFVVESSYTKTPPTIDGTISPNEWGTSSFYVLKTNFDEGEMTGYMLNDDKYLYVAALIPHQKIPQIAEDKAIAGDLVGYDFQIEFNDVETNKKDVKGISVSKDDFYYYDTFQSSEYMYSMDDNNDGEGGASHSNYNGIGDFTFEFKIPLNSDDSQDIPLINSEVEMQIFASETIKQSDEFWGEAIIEWPMQIDWKYDFAKLKLSDVNIIPTSSPNDLLIDYLTDDTESITFTDDSTTSHFIEKSIKLENSCNNCHGIFHGIYYETTYLTSENDVLIEDGWYYSTPLDDVLGSLTGILSSVQLTAKHSYKIPDECGGFIANSI